MPVPTRFVRTLGTYAHRLQPKTLRGRLVMAACGFSVMGVAATFALVHFAAVTQFDSLAVSTARQQVAAFRTFLTIEQEDLSGHTSEIASAVTRHASTPGTATPLWLQERLRAARATAYLRTDGAGALIHATGDAKELMALRSLVARPPDGSTCGLLWADDRVLIVSWRETVDARGKPSGFLAVARPLDPAVRARFTALSEGLTVTLRPPSAIAVAQAEAIGGFEHARIQMGGGTAHTVVELPGVTSASAGLAQLDLSDARLTASMGAAGRAAVITAMLVGVLGAALGLALGTAVRLPIDRTRRHLRDQAPLALEGLPCAPMKTRPETTSEFRQLASDVDGLLSALSRRQAELVAATREARAAQESLRAALDGSAEGKLLVEGTEIVLANRAADDILGIPLDRLVGMPVADLALLVTAFAEDGRRIDAAEAAGVTGNGPLVARLDLPDRPERWVEITTHVLAPEPPRVLLTVRDITEERHLDAMREEIFSIVSHDLRAPLTVVQGYLDILERPLKPDARQRALESARHNAAKMAGLLEDLLDTTAADRLLAPKNAQPVDLVVLAGEVATSAEAASVGHHLVVAAPDAPVHVSGEERRLRQALLNLVTNAIKYSPEGTTVTLRVTADDSRATLAVEDEGPGIPAESRDSVFERYGRLASTAEGKPGLGLGLYIVRVIAENHGGEARVEETPQGGARFVIELPLLV